MVSEIHDVDVGAEPDVVGEVPAVVVWIGVDYDIVGAPEPVAAVIIVVRGDIKVETAKPKTLPVPAFNPVNMSAAGFAAKSSMFPGMIEVVVGIVPAGVVPDPLVVSRMDVGRFGMPGLVAIGGMRVTWLPTPAALCRRSMGGRGGGAMRRNVTAANLTRGAAFMSPAPLGAPPSPFFWASAGADAIKSTASRPTSFFMSQPPRRFLPPFSGQPGLVLRQHFGFAPLKPSRNGAGGGGRTHTAGKGHRILSPARLPVPPLQPLTLSLSHQKSNCNTGASACGICLRLR